MKLNNFQIIMSCNNWKNSRLIHEFVTNKNGNIHTYVRVSDAPVIYMLHF